MSPPVKATSTSWPTRGVKFDPQFAPASISPTRTHVPDASDAGAPEPPLDVDSDR